MPSRAGKTVFLLGLAALSLMGCDHFSSSSLKIGDAAPVIRTKTLADVGGDFSRITTYRYPDERMYQYSVDAALKERKPIVLEFATPGHCTVCDGQLQMLKSLMNQYGSQVLFLHMDQYENPGAFIAYQVKGDPWTFIIDRDGIVRYKQPGRMLYGELERVIVNVLKGEVG